MSISVIRHKVEVGSLVESTIDVEDERLPTLLNAPDISQTLVVTALKNPEKTQCLNKNDAVFNEDKIKWKRRGLHYQLFMCALANLSVLGPSMGFGYSAVALPVLRSNLTEEIYVNDEQASWIASALAIGTPVGCIASTFLLLRGRKLSLIITSTVSILGWLIIFLSKTYKFILVGRVLSGISMGLASVPATVYSAEVTSPEIRCTTSTWPSMVIACGILLVYIFGYTFPNNWRIVALLCAVFPMVTIMLTAILLPESPIWLKDHGQMKDAEKILKKFNGLPEGHLLSVDLIDQIKPNVSKRRIENTLFEELRCRKAMKPFIIMLCFFFFQQFSGIFAIVYYAVDVTKDAGLVIDGYFGAILIGLTRLCGTFVITLISKKFGRRIPSIVSGIGMTTFMLILSTYLFLNNEIVIIQDSGVIPAVCIMMYIFMSTIGFLTIPFAMIGEIYTTSVKDILLGITTCLAYIFSFITVKIYPDMIVIMGKQGIFFFYAVASFIGTLFVTYFLPETKDKTLIEIEKLFCTKEKKRIDSNSTELDKELTIPLSYMYNNK